MRSRTMVVLLTCALVLAGCGGGAVESSSADAPGSVEPSAPPPSAEPSPQPSEDPAPTEAPGPLTVAWDEARPFDGQPAELFVDGDTWIAAGWATERGPAAWTSSDGQTWARASVPDPQPDDIFRGSGLGPIARLGDSLLSFGTFIGCCDGRGVIGWRSADGTSWEVIESNSPLFEQGYLVRGLAAGDEALVAAEVQYAEFGGRIWRWTEATSWVDTTPGTGSGLPSGLQPNDVAWTEDGFVVVGTRGDSAYAEPPVGASWVSADGLTWQESAATPELEGVRLVAVAPLPAGGYLSLGYADGPIPDYAMVPLAFTSPDGSAWTAVENLFGESRWRPEDLVITDDGLIAFGSSDGNTVAWATNDGQSWTDAGALPFAYQDAAALDDEIIAFTVDYNRSTGWYIHRGTIGRPN